MSLNFPSSPVIGQIHEGYVWDGEKWVALGGSGAAGIPDAPTDGVLYGRKNALWQKAVDAAGDTMTGPLVLPANPTLPLQAAPKQYVDNSITTLHAAPFDALAYNGMQVNGSCGVSQENGTSLVAIPSGAVTKYIIDSWLIEKTGTSVLNAFQTPPQEGFDGVLQFDVSTPQASLGANDYVRFRNRIEGYRIARLRWGTASAQPVTIGFWMRLSLPGTYRLNILNYNGSQTSGWYPFTINASMVWQWVTVTIPGATTGTWSDSNNIGMDIVIEVASSVTPNNAGTASNHMNITGLVVLPGTQAPTAAQSTLIMRPYDQELMTCKRYWQKFGGVLTNAFLIQAYAASTSVAYTAPLPVEMRSSPTITEVGTWTKINIGSMSFRPSDPRVLNVQFNTSATGAILYSNADANSYLSFDARL
jgi:hypothetical protein